MGVSRGAKIKSRLAAQGLTSHWLMMRIADEFGIEVEKTRMSQILGGTGTNGPVTLEVLDCAEKVLDRYEEHYKKEGA